MEKHDRCLRRTYSEELLDADEYNSTKCLSDVNQLTQTALNSWDLRQMYGPYHFVVYSLCCSLEIFWWVFILSKPAELEFLLCGSWKHQGFGANITQMPCKLCYSNCTKKHSCSYKIWWSVNTLFLTCMSDVAVFLLRTPETATSIVRLKSSSWIFSVSHFLPLEPILKFVKMVGFFLNGL